MALGSPGYLSSRTRRRRDREGRLSLRRQSAASDGPLHLEALEPRQLLAQLIGILPNDGQLLEEGQILSVAPTQLTFRFDATPPLLDPSTIAENILIRRSGFDGIFGNGNDVVRCLQSRRAPRCLGRSAPWQAVEEVCGPDLPVRQKGVPAARRPTADVRGCASDPRHTAAV